MVGSRDEISFEVHVFRWDRWEVHGRYPAGKKDAAVKDARSLERISTIGAVRVIRAYDPAEGLRQQTTIYESPSLTSRRGRDAGRHPKPSKSQSALDRRQEAARTKAGTGAQGKQKSRSAAARAASRGPQQRSSNLVVFVKILLITLFSIILGGLVMGLASLWLSEEWLGSELQSSVLVGIFLVTFLLSAISMALTFLSPQDFGTWSRQARADARHRREKAAAKPAPQHDAEEAAVPEEATALAEAAAAQLAEALHGDASESPTPQVATEATEIVDAEAADETAQPAEAAEMDATPTEAVEATTHEEPPSPDQAQGTQEQEPAQPVSAYTPEQMAAMTAFVDRALGDVDHRNLDTYEKFGLDLFVAGACEALAQGRTMRNEASAQMLGDFVQSLGFTKSQADAFRERYPEYLVEDPRYMQMFMAGRNALRAHLDGDPHTAQHFQQALVDWNAPKIRDAPGLIAVLFTDIADSTDLTQAKGDDIAQEVVHAHNQIVRDTLAEFSGREIKHTGDGIMASFSVTSNSVQAASAIQRRAAAHNGDFPDLPLHLKIGINAGEPITEDDDLFGTTVQIAARIVAKAQADQILVSEIVRGICAGKKIDFVNRGPHALKGFKGDLTLYEVIWDGTAGTTEESSDEPAQPQPETDGETPHDDAQLAAATGDPGPPQAPAPASETPAAAGPQDAEIHEDMPPAVASLAETGEAPAPVDDGTEETAATAATGTPTEQVKEPDPPPPSEPRSVPAPAPTLKPVPSESEKAAQSQPSEQKPQAGSEIAAGAGAAPPGQATAQPKIKSTPEDRTSS